MKFTSACVLSLVDAQLFLSVKDCPGGSLNACIDGCPAAEFQACVENCQAQCGSTPTPAPSPAPVPPPVPAPTPAPGNNTCMAYAQGPYAQCSDNCGSCFNAGGRPGVICQGGGLSATGYLCPPDAQGGDMAFACMDWTFGSKTMQAQEASFSARTGEHVYFGVGSFGSDDPQSGLGMCVRLTVEGVSKDIIAQSINTGSDVSGNQFDLQVGDGGAGLFNACAGGSSPGTNSMFSGSKDAWGHQYGGVDNREDCSGLPSFPAVSDAMKSSGDDLVSLCEYSFDHAVRGEGGHNPSILSIGRVQCPEELVFMTQMQRNDDPSGFTPTSPMKAEHECQADIPNMPLDWCLTRMMDCRKPSGAWRSSVKPELMVSGRKLVQTCTSDGYTRIDNQCGCFDCDC